MKSHYTLLAAMVAGLFSAAMPLKMADDDLSLAAAEDLDGLLDASLDEIEDLPDYVTPPNGFYKLKVNIDKKKEIKEKKAVQFKFTVIETIQLNNQAESPVKEGSIFTQAFFPDTSQEKANVWRWLKKAVKPFIDATGAPNLSVALDAMEDQVITAVVTLRPNDAKNPTVWYPQVDKMTPA